MSGVADPSQTQGSSARALQYTTCDSPLGELLLVGEEKALHGLYMQDGPRPKSLESSWKRATAPFTQARRQLDEYFEGKRVSFELPLAMHGTPFECQVWEELQAIPYGATISYGELARRIGRPSGPRAVGLANGRNPISVVVPCHRVIGVNGSLIGYGGGLQRKRALLALERLHARG